jgi:predicted enzyme related to lactoylglutathione lyase
MANPNLNWILLYVADTMASAKFYSRLLGADPVAAPKGPTDFVMFSLPGGWTLGLWQKDDVEPKATAPGGTEISFTEPDAEAVKKRHADWSRDGVEIVQRPIKLDFGMTFTAMDPDGHRLRVFAPA